MNPVIYVFLNKSLHMTAGKAAAQAVHATMLSMADTERAVRDFWVSTPHKTVIILEARDESHLNNIRKYLAAREFKTYEVVDEGVNECDPHTVTAVATDMLDKDDERVQLTLSTFKLYRDTVIVKVEVEK